MKIALVHDYLNQYGGAERVLEVLTEIFPQAPIYTILYDSAITMNRFSGRIKKTSFLDFDFARKHHRLFIPLMPAAIKLMTIKDDYDFIISDTAGFAKGISLNPKRSARNPIHISYIHTPLRYAWEQENYLSGRLSSGSLLLAKPILNWLRRWDYAAAQKPDIIITNSNFIAEKIKQYYGREALVIYPPADTKKFYYKPAPAIETIQPYYLAVGRLLHYKKFDLIIDAFAQLGLPLKIVGTGPEKQNLESRIKNLNAKNITLMGFVDDNELHQLYIGAKALVFPHIEDFGLVAAEAQACGLPVIAYAAGGATEIVEPNVTGLFFAKQTPQSLIEAVHKFETIKLNRKAISRHAQKFSKEKFKKRFADVINQVAKLL